MPCAAHPPPPPDCPPLRSPGCHPGDTEHDAAGGTLHGESHQRNPLVRPLAAGSPRPHSAAAGSHRCTWLAGEGLCDVTRPACSPPVPSQVLAGLAVRPSDHRLRALHAHVRGGCRQVPTCGRGGGTVCMPHVPPPCSLAAAHAPPSTTLHPYTPHKLPPRRIITKRSAQAMGGLALTFVRVVVHPFIWSTVLMAFRFFLRHAGKRDRAACIGAHSEAGGPGPALAAARTSNLHSLVLPSPTALSSCLSSCPTT